MSKLFILTLISASAFAGPAQAARPEPLTQTFVVDWSRDGAEDGGVQMCDDTYVAYAEILVPSDPAGLNLRAVVSTCPSVKIKHLDQVYTQGKDYDRVLLKGMWDCEFVFQKPVTPQSPAPAKYTVRLVDGC